MIEYDLIRSHYGDRCSRRFKLPLMNHINEGLRILHHLKAAPETLRAWCIHPIVQYDASLALTVLSPHRISGVSPVAMLLAMEYRTTANAALANRDISTSSQIDLSPLDQVNTMLIADKIQNRKDFLSNSAEHFTDDRFAQLDVYFTCWLNRLGVTLEDRVRLARIAEEGNLESALAYMNA